MNFIKLLCLFISMLYVISCGKSEQKPLVKSSYNNAEKDTCDSPDADINCSFRDMPSDMTNIMQITNPDEPGNKLTITGRILHSDSATPYSNIIMYAYHTDSTGHYSKKGNETGVMKWHGYLHGWCITDSSGYYEIQTIRPGRYPSNEFPAHIHPVIKKPDSSQPFYINDFVFEDDSLVDEKYISSLMYGGGTGIMKLQKLSDSTLKGQRDIILN